MSDALFDDVLNLVFDRADVALGEEQWVPRFRGAGWRYNPAALPRQLLEELTKKQPHSLCRQFFALTRCNFVEWRESLFVRGMFRDGGTEEPALTSAIESGVKSCQGFWKAHASTGYYTVCYTLDLLSALQSRGLSQVAARALAASRPHICFTARARAKIRGTVWVQLDLKLLGFPTVGRGCEADTGTEVEICHETTRCRLSSDHCTALSVSGQAAQTTCVSGLELTLRVEDSRFWKAAESAAVTDPQLIMVQA